MDNFRDQETICNTLGRERKKILSEADERFMGTQIEANLQIRASQLCAEVSIQIKKQVSVRDSLSNRSSR